MRINKQALAKFADLKVQAMMFDMDIDIETWSLVEKNTFKHPFWVTRYRDKLDNSDYMSDGSDDQEWSEDDR